MGSLVTGKPPAKWVDTDEEIFYQELEHICARLRRVESANFGLRQDAGDGSAVRVAITQTDGEEVDQVIYISQEEESDVARLEAEVTQILKGHQRLGLAATSRAVWKLLLQSELNKNE